MSLPLLLQAAAHLVGSNKSEAAQDLKAVLSSRLDQSQADLGRSGTDPLRQDLEDIQLQTAKEALFVVCAIQEVLSAPVQVPESSTEAPAVGTRDLAHIRTLLSIVFKWGTEPLLGRVSMSWPSNATSKTPVQSKIIDLTKGPDDYKDLCSMTHQLLSIALPLGHKGPISQTFVANALLVRHITDILKPSIAAGWLPKALSSDSMPTQDGLRPFVMRLLSLQPSQTIVALGGVMSSSPALPPHVQKGCSFLLGRQLIRPAGVQGLCAAIFGDEEVSEGEISLEKLEHVSKVLNTIPPSMAVEEFYKAIIPQLLVLLSDEGDRSFPAYRRSAAFSLSRMFSDQAVHRSLVSSILLPRVHDALLRETPDVDTGEVEKLDKAKIGLTPSQSISTLQVLLLNTDPSPTFVSALFTPIAPSLYALHAHLESTKTSDPAFKEMLKSLLETWARVVFADEVIAACWSVIRGDGGYWKVDIAGDIRRSDSPEKTSKLSLFTPEELQRAEDNGDLDIDTNLLDLRPNPLHFVGFLKSINRTDVAADLFVGLLEKYGKLKADRDSDPLRTLLYLQLVIQIQTKLADTNSSANILKKPEHILAFIKHSLESGSSSKITTRLDEDRTKRHGLGLDDLRIIPEQENDLESEDSDDEIPDSESAAPDEEMTVTTINLLLAILEVNTELSARNAPVLNDIFSFLEPLSKESSEAVKPLAREARMVMTARLASTSSSQPTSRRKPEEEDSHQLYQKALTLLQDPLLPVRAHGLMLLRQLVSPAELGGKPSLEPALVPAVLSIFLQSIQDDDSYMFLNAVQGLAAMVDGFGKEVLRGLMKDYASRLQDGVGLTQSDVDMRVRIGEALGQVIRRCDQALPLYVDILAPPLARLVRASHLPTTIRTSALSLLAQMASTSPIALLPYAADLFDGMIDLLQLESVSAASSRGTGESAAPTMDSQPTAANSKFPPLRRAALHFLTLLVRACITRVYDMGASGSMIPQSSVSRARTVLSYIASVDEDGIVKVMAREAKENLDQLANAIIGL